MTKLNLNKTVILATIFILVGFQRLGVQKKVGWGGGGGGGLINCIWKATAEKSFGAGSRW